MATRTGERGARGAWGLLLRPGSWPIALKLSLTLLLVALVPMATIAVINLDRGLVSLEAAERENLELLATSTAGRLDQLLVDSSRVVAQVAGDAEVEAFLGASREERSATRASVERTLQNVVGSNPDVASVFLLDAPGVCIATTNQEQMAQSFAFREYYQQTLGGEPFISEILSGNTTEQLGVYLSRPVHGGIPPQRRGVVVLKLKASAIDRMIDGLHVGGQGRAMLVDGYGVVVSYPDLSIKYHSLAPLSPAARALPVFHQRFSSIGVEQIDDLGLPGLSAAILGAREPGSASFVAPWSGARQTAGYAPLATKPWVVLVHEPEAEFQEPLRALARRAGLSVLIVGAAVTLLALLIEAGDLHEPIAHIDLARRGHPPGLQARRQRLDLLPPRVVGALERLEPRGQRVCPELLDNLVFLLRLLRDRRGRLAADLRHPEGRPRRLLLRQERVLLRP
jgi:C4-dicarboxylate-specific signal transduction histidine kinase